MNNKIKHIDNKINSSVKTVVKLKTGPVNVVWDGKLGCWVESKRNSTNFVCNNRRFEKCCEFRKQ